MKNKQQTMSRGFAVLSISNILVKVLSLFFVPILRKMLGGASVFGVYSVSNEVFAFVYVLATAGLPVAIAKLVSELVSKKDEQNAERAFKMARTIMFSIGTVLTIVMAVLSKPIARLMNAEDAWGGILFISPTIMICSLLSAYKGYFQGRKNMNPTAISQVMEQFIHMVISFAMVLILGQFGTVWAVAGAATGTVIGALASLVFMVLQRKKLSAEIHRARLETIRSSGSEALDTVMDSPVDDLREPKLTTKDLVKRIFYYSIPITLNTAIQYAGNMIDASVLLGRFKAAGCLAEEAQALFGDLAGTRQLLNVPTSIISAMCVSILPTMAALHALKDHSKKTVKANEGYKLCYLIAVPMTAGFAVFAQPVFRLLGYGDNYMLLMALAFSVILHGTVHLQSSILQSVNRLFTSMLFMGIGAVVKLLLSYILAATSITVYGAVISTYASLLVPFILNQWVLNKKENLNIMILGNLWKPSLSAVFMVMVGFPLYQLMMFILPEEAYLSVLFAFAFTVIVCVVVYGYVLIKIGGVTQEDVKEISPAIARHWPKKIKRIF